MVAQVLCVSALRVAVCPSVTPFLLVSIAVNVVI
jgi:hypothetical protein